jgi:lipid A disaccharide synthetase
VNILKKEAIYPELIGRGFGPADLKRELENIHFNSMERTHIIKSCEDLKKLLEADSAHQRAAEAIRRIL